MWSIEHFKNYVYGIQFGVVADHKALKSVLSANKGNKTFSSRLTRWVDRLLPYDFHIVHTPRRTLRMAENLSRNPSKCKESIIQYEEMFKEWFTVNVEDEFTNGLKQTVLTKRKELIR